MAKRIDKGCDDTDARIRFHISSARMGIPKMSYVAFQRYLDRLERSMYRCGECGWGGSGRELIPMEAANGRDCFGPGLEADTWYACPRCEAFVDPNRPVLSPAD